MQLYGNGAYRKARTIAQAARVAGDNRIDRFYTAVAKCIANQFDFEVSVDTATRYLKPRRADQKQAPYDPGSGRVIARPLRVTIH
jgi:hypothetical protein